MLSQLDIKECKGCEQCLIRGEQYCPIKDDLQLVVSKMIEADGMILVSPVYACQISATMKKIVDRLSYLFHRPRLIAKPMITVVTSAGGAIPTTQKYLKLVAGGWGGNLIGQLGIVSIRYFDKRWGGAKGDIKYQAKIQKQMDKIVDAFAECMEKRKLGELPNPTLYDIYIFNGLKSKTYTSKADYDYWQKQGWLNNHYYYDAKMPVGSKLIEKTIELLVKSMSKKLGIVGD